VITGLGAIAITRSVISLIESPVGFDWIVLAALTLLTGSFSIKVPTVNARISVSEAFVFTGVLLFGPHVATIIVALDSLVLTSWLRSPSRSPLRALFNMTAGALAISVASEILAWMLPVHPAAAAPLERLLVPVFCLALSYFMINSWLVAVAVGFERNASAANLWRRNFLWLSLNYMGGASVALVLVSYARNINLAAVSVIVPLLVVIYLTFRTSWGRLEDANKHVTQLNELYLSTIEALAMAVDAKDQITHGHIRRVQVYAIELARRLGVSDERQLRAIEAAALLHDMGKLAIPEHILNKPGRLTPAEFDRMKQHAELGADLLSSIRFPYPVVPIVRHHHEDWNGRGYPSGISGTDIPLGARILSVVDCFDALTSDRPYRPRLSNAEAFKILMERRGTMYDPLVVDTFVRTYAEIAPAALRAGQEARSILGSDAANSDATITRPLRQIRANATEAALLTRYGQQIRGATSPRDAIEAAVQCLRQLTPGTVYVWYLFDSRSDSLVCELAFGDQQNALRGLTIPLGERVSGWAGANRQTAVNSDATLDLAQISRLFDPALRSTISTPLANDDQLFGVLTAYACTEQAFSDGHRDIFEQVAGLLLQKVTPGQTGSSTNVISFRMTKQHSAL
jgi:putative nucleotidyltransferase with HDIG domain